MKVTVYSTPSCPMCNLLKKWLKDHNIEFASIDVSKSPKLIDELIKKSGQMVVPVTEIDGTIIVGFDMNELKKALKIK